MVLSKVSLLLFMSLYLTKCQQSVDSQSSIYKYALNGQVNYPWPRFEDESSSCKYYLNEPHPPCSFNTQCMCSNNGMALGLVFCDDVELGQIPKALNNTRVHTLTLRNNKLRHLGEFVFYRTGMFRLEISNNLLIDIQPKSFAGIERSLWELAVTGNKLHKVPATALGGLAKLVSLDLSGNHISDISPRDFDGLGKSLKSLNLADNSLVDIPQEAFRALSNLRSLDLHGNNIYYIYEKAFVKASRYLTDINLSGNLMEQIPLRAISDLSSKPNINLAMNRIYTPFDHTFVGIVHIQTLILDMNRIEFLQSFSFKNFGRMAKLSLRGNPLVEIAEDAFKNSKINEIYLHDCELSILSEKSFKGLENNLQLLDLSYNNLSTLPKGIFEHLDAVKSLSLSHNKLLLDPTTAFNGFKYTLTNLDLLGPSMPDFPLDSLKDIRNVRTLGLSTVLNGEIMKEDFLGFGPGVEKLYLQNNRITSIGERAFEYVPGIKILDLSYNYIMFIHHEAFFNIGGGLEKLRINDGLAFNNLQEQVMKSLVNLKELDLSNNKLFYVEAGCLKYLRSLQKLLLKDNKIKSLSRDHFDGRFHQHLKMIQLSFNDITKISTHTFHDYESLKYIFLDDNLIRSIERHAFSNMANLEYLHLQGNDIKFLEFEAFQTMPKLRYLDLSYNKMTNLNLDAFEQIGSLSTLTVDASYNNIEYLHINGTMWSSSSGIKNIIFSHNNISSIHPLYFESLKSSLLNLRFDHNNLGNLSGEIFHYMQHLSRLDFSYNRIANINSRAFKDTNSIQIINFSHNRISEIPHKLLQNQRNLRHVDLSYNLLRLIPDSLFADSSLEIFRANHNKLTIFPKEVLQRSSETLKIIDLSYNNIRELTDATLSGFDQLISLDVSGNWIKTIQERTFRSLGRLVALDISHNPIKYVNKYTFDGLEDNLQTLSLSNISLTTIPELRLPKLTEFNVSHNFISFLPSMTMGNISSIRSLDLSFNQLPSTSTNAWKVVRRLLDLKLQGNPVRTITNDSFIGLDRVEKLDMRFFSLQIFQSGNFVYLPSIRTLAIDSEYSQIRNFHLAPALHMAPSIQSLHLQTGRELNNVLHGAAIPPRLTNVTILGENLQKISTTFFKMLTSRELRLSFYKTTIRDIPRDFFRNMGSVKFVALSVENSTLESIGPPSSTRYSGRPSSIYLTDIRIAGNSWNCDCRLGWIEEWLKDWRSDVCVNDGKINSYFQCESSLKSLRSSTCANRRGKSVMESLKKDLECGASSATSIFPFTYFLVPVTWIFLFSKAVTPYI